MNPVMYSFINAINHIFDLGDELSMHYIGTYYGGDKHGQEFDSSLNRGKPFSFNIGEGQVIKGIVKLLHIFNVLMQAIYVIFKDGTKELFK